MHQLSILSNAIQTMSSREIAELTGKRHPDVTRDIEKMLLELGEDARSFAHIYLDSMNREQVEYHLDRELTETLLTGYSAVLRRKVIARWRELEFGKVQPAQPSAIPNAKEFRALFGIARLIGLDKNVAAISANQAVIKLTGANMLALLGQAHLDNPEQVQYFTPSELGGRSGISGAAFNKLLLAAGLQTKLGKKWLPTVKGKGFARVLDTGKRHDEGAMVQQVKWADAVLKEVQS